MIENDDCTRNYLNEINSVANEQMYPNGNNNSIGNNNEHNINVVIRVRPIITPPRTSTLNKSIIQTESDQRQQHDETDADQSTAITFPAAGQIQIEDAIANVNRSFSFNVVFEPEASQEEVFEHSGVKRLIDMALDGFACTVFAYGQTSTGKTYTLTGNVFQNGRENRSSSSSSSNNKNKNYKKEIKNSYNKLMFDNDNNGNSTNGGNSHLNEYENEITKPLVKNIGIVQLSFAYLFEQIKRRKLRDKTLYVITVSYLEVYNEQVLDLLNPSHRCLNVRWAKDRGFYAENLFKVECEDLGDLEGVLEEGCKNRQVRSHSMNENSSRSHSVMTITLFSEVADPEDPQGFIRKEGRLCLVDLAGSEKTKRTNSKGGTFVEANNINRSLLVLGNCIACLADPKRRNGHIPYRDSTLTKLLADSLSGNGMTLMIACVSSLKCDSQETISTLRYASRAKRVRMNPVVQMDPRELLILSLKREVRMLKIENNYLKQNCHQIWTNNHKPPLQSVYHQDSNTLQSHPFGDDVNNRNATTNKNEENNLLDKYMKENEVLRVENVQINLQRNRLVRDHELVCRENEQLLRKLNLLLYKLNSSDIKHSSIAMFANNNNNRHHHHQLPLQHQSLFSSASSPSILSLVYEDELKNLRDGISSQISQQQLQQLEASNVVKYVPNMLPMDDTHDPSDMEDPTIDDNDLFIIRPNQKVSLPSAPHINNNSNKSNHHITKADQMKANNDKNLLDLTIRGKSAAVNNKTRILSTSKRR